jgi:hypothetical protein
VRLGESPDDPQSGPILLRAKRGEGAHSFAIHENWVMIYAAMLFVIMRKWWVKAENVFYHNTPGFIRLAQPRYNTICILINIAHLGDFVVPLFEILLIDA